jgi:capsular polysaccharide transport system permease protein
MTMTHSDTRPKITIGAALREKRNVMTAVVLRDIRSRYFNHGLGFLLVAIWPLAHMLILLAVYGLLGRQAPYGDSLRVFFATGLIPTLAFMYVSRWMSLSLILNRPMLAFPVVTVIDIMAARAFLEITAAVLTLIFLFAILLFLGDNPYPADPYQAAYAYLASLLLALGFGSVAGVLVMFMPVFATVYALTMILFYLLSGTLFVPSALPEPIAYALSWNPVFQTVEWMRSAYYLGYSGKYLDKAYTLGFGMSSLCLGLLMERIFRRRMLEA